MALNTGTVPLSQALPWSDPPSCILITDSVETDGRFMLHTIATQAQNDVLWLACGPLTDTLVATALRKMGCEAAATYLKIKPSANEWKRPLAIHSVTNDLATSMDEQSTGEVYLKNLYKRIKEWCSDSTTTTTIIVDDVSALSNLFGERLTYFFVAYLRTVPHCQVVLRCSNDIDKEAFQEEELPSVHPSRKVDWVGAGGTRVVAASQPWERTLVEFADWIVDVVPLASGYSREAHGRLVFTSSSGAESSLVMNYCLQDTSVSAIRLQR